VEKVDTDPDLQSKVQAIAPGDKDAALEEIVRIASEAGFSFTVEDYEAAALEMAQDRHAAGELSDEDLDAVAGGADLFDQSLIMRTCPPDDDGSLDDIPMRSGGVCDDFPLK